MANERLPRTVRRLFRLPWQSASSIAKDVDDELRFHVQMRAEEFIASGMDRESAMAEAWRSFGDASDVREHAVAVNADVMRRTQVVEWIGGVMQDIRFTLRQARRAPLFTAIAVATLAVGIGANTAIFSVVDRLLISPLPFADGNRLAWLTRVGAQGHIFILPGAEVVKAWKARAHLLEGIGAATESDVEFGRGQRAETVKGGAMSVNLLSLLGVRPALGRGFQARDEAADAPPTAMLGYDEWQSEFGGRADVIGRTITVDSVVREIVGVVPAGFVVPFTGSEVARSVWAPLSDTVTNATIVGKLRDRASIDAVNHELTALAAQASAGGPFANWGARALREQDMLGAGLRQGILLLFGAVGVVLLIACANVANLLLVRAWSRKRELAIRTALGAGRSRLVRQLAAESLAIAVAGGAAGLALAWGAVRVFVKLRPQGLDDLSRVRIEPAALAWTMVVSLATGLLFGLAPAMFATARGLTDGLKAGARDTEGHGGARLFRSSIIVAEIALSVLLLVSAGLLVRSFRAMQSVDVGFNPHGLTAVTVRIDRALTESQRRIVATGFLKRMRETPGVEGAVFTAELPPGLGVSEGGFQVEGSDPSRDPTIGVTGFVMAQPGYFKTAGIRLRGRTFDGDSTGLDSLPPTEIVVNQRLAKRLWPNSDAIGRRVHIGTKMYSVVGVANDITIPGRSGDMYDLQLYVPWVPMQWRMVTVLFRSSLDEHAMTAAVRGAISDMSAQLHLVTTRTSDAELRAMLAPAKFATALVSAFAFIALFLSVVGLYGVIAYAVSQRTREIGVRIALGAEPSDIARLVLRRGAVLVGAGLLAGIVLSAAGSRLLHAYLYGIGERDPITYAAIVTLLGAAALLAAYAPARRAMRVDPVVALSAE